MNDNNWKIYNNGKTIGQIGSEKGIIIKDEENINGARITIEKNCRSIPFAITLGIYGVMVHTAYFSDENITENKLEEIKLVIDKSIKIFEIEENKRDNDWDIKYNTLMDELVSF